MLNVQQQTQGKQRKVKYILFAVLFILTLGIAFFSFFRERFFQATPSESIIQTGAPKPRRLQRVTFTGTQPEFPRELPLYNGSSTFQDPSNFTALLAQRLQFTQGQLPTVWVNTQTGENLSYSPTAKSITYVKAETRVTPSLTLQNTRIDTTRAVNTATTFIHDAFGITALVPDTQHVLYLTQEGQVDNIQEATFVQISFNYTLDGYPTYYDIAHRGAAEVTVGKTQSVQKVVLYLLPQNPQQGEVKSLLSINQAIEQIKVGNVEVLTASSNFGKPLTLEDIDALDITGVSLEYRFSQNTQVFYPYYRFSGIGSIGSEQISDMTLILPAVQL